MREVAACTEGMSGAELANLANEAAIRAVRHGRDAVGRADFEEALLEYRGSRTIAEQPLAAGASGAQLVAQLGAMAATFQAMQAHSSPEDPE